MTKPMPAETQPRRHFLARLLGLAGISAAASARSAEADTQGTQPYIGEIMICGFGFAPQGWALCNGQLLPILQNQALFSLLGIHYGGDGVNTFALPDLRGRVPIHEGQGAGLTLRTRGDRSGATTHLLTVAELAAHTHTARAAALTATVVGASSTQVFARNPAAVPQWGAGTSTAMHTTAISTVGGGLAHPNQQPYSTLSYVIATQGIYPS